MEGGLGTGFSSTAAAAAAFFDFLGFAGAASSSVPDSAGLLPEEGVLGFLPVCWSLGVPVVWICAGGTTEADKGGMVL